MKRHINKVDLKGIIFGEVHSLKFADGKRYSRVVLLTENINTNKDGSENKRCEKHLLIFWNSLSDLATHLEIGKNIRVSGTLHYNNNETEIIVNEFDEVLN
jgi:hypothetical protein